MNTAIPISQNPIFSKLAEIRELFHPIMSAFKIKYVCYNRIYPNGKTVQLATSMEQTEHYFKNQYTSPTPFQCGLGKSTGIYLPSKADSDHRTDRKSWLLKGIPKQKEIFRVDNPIILINTNGNHIEFCMLFSDVDNHSFTNTILNHQDSLNAWIQNTVINEKKLIQCAEANPIFQVQIEDFFDPLEDTDISLSSNQAPAKHPFTKREFETVELLSRGRTAKQIARILKKADGNELSYRTVEDNIAKAKDKINVHFKSDLVDYYYEHLALQVHFSIAG